MYVPLRSYSSDRGQLSGDGFLVFDATDGEMRGLAVQSLAQFMDDFQRFLNSGGREE
jgi:hypothetical protein